MSLYAIKDEDGELRDTSWDSPNITREFYAYTDVSVDDATREAAKHRDSHVVELAEKADKQRVARVVGQEPHRLTPDDWAHITDPPPRLYYLVRYYPKAAQHDYYLVRSGHTRVELPGYRYPDAQWTWDECERIDSKHRYKRVLVEDE